MVAGGLEELYVRESIYGCPVFLVGTQAGAGDDLRKTKSWRKTKRKIHRSKDGLFMHDAAGLNIVSRWTRMDSLSGGFALDGRDFPVEYSEQ